MFQMFPKSPASFSLKMRLNRRVTFFIKFFVGFQVGYFVLALVVHVFKPATNTAIDQKLAEILFNEVRIACLVNTMKENHKTRAIYIKRTWGRKCNKLFFITSEHDPELNTIVVPLNETKTMLRKKIRAAFLHVYENHLDEFDWLLKADDDK
jgi:hypothetical protein